MVNDQTETPPTMTSLRAYRYALDPTYAQLESLQRHAGAARWAFNHSLAAKIAAHQTWRAQVDQLVDEQSIPREVARTQARTPMPTKPTIQREWNRLKGDTRTMTPGYAPWWHEVSTYAFQSAFIDADAAWRNWLDSLQGRRAGRQVGYPRFKKKGRSRESFRIHHDVKRPTIRPITYRRLLVPRLGEVRVHGTMKRLTRAIARGEAIVQSVTISRSGSRWYASILTKTTAQPRQATRAQRTAGTVGVDVGVKQLAALSTGELIPNPRHLRRARRRLVKVQRALSRTQPTSRGRQRARARLARAHHEVTQQRSTALHQLTKRLTTRWASVAIEDLHLAGMTASARGTIDNPGRNVAAKAGLNQAILDAGLAELRRQLTYKTRWYGADLVVIDRWAPTSKTCSTCGWRNPSLSLSERTYQCQSCGLRIDRDLNAAINIRAAVTDPAAWQAAVASGIGETQNARGGPVRPEHPSGAGQGLPKREDTEASPQQSDLLALSRTG